MLQPCAYTFLLNVAVLLTNMTLCNAALILGQARVSWIYVACRAIVRLVLFGTCCRKKCARTKTKPIPPSCSTATRARTLRSSLSQVQQPLGVIASVNPRLAYFCARTAHARLYTQLHASLSECRCTCSNTRVGRSCECPQGWLEQYDATGRPK